MARPPEHIQLQDLDAERLGLQVAREFLAHTTLVADVLGSAAGRIRADVADEVLAATPVARTVAQLVRFAQAGDRLTPVQAEDLVLRFLAVLNARPRGAVPHRPTHYRALDPLLNADLRLREGDEDEDEDDAGDRDVTAITPPPFPELAILLLALKARIHLAKGLPIAARELSAVANVSTQHVRFVIRKRGLRTLGERQMRRFEGVPGERGGRIPAEDALAFLGTAGVPGFK